MRKLRLVLALCVTTCAVGHAQLRLQKITEPAGKTLDKALKASSLTQPGAKPFHLKLVITATKGDPATYAATIEETWYDPTHWRRVVSGAEVTETTVVNDSGTHYSGSGDYMPMWLRSYETALFNPVPDASHWNLSRTPLEHMEFPNGSRSNPCQHAEFMLGVAPEQQINFANVCFRPDGLLDFVGSPSYAMEFHDYAGFGKLRVARTLIEDPMRGVNLKGQIVTLEPAGPGDLVAAPDSPSAGPFATVMVDGAMMKKLAGSLVTFQWPNPIPGHGMFTVWVSLDRTGKVREVYSLNSDESGIAGDMSAQLLGRQWQAAVVDGKNVQVQGPIVVSYPPAAPGAP